MDSLSHLLALLAPRCEVNLHCRFGGRWQAGHQQMRSGVVPWHVVLRGEGRLNVGGQTHHLRAGDVVLLPHGSPHLMESLVEWGQVLPVAHRFNGTVTEMRAGPAEGALESMAARAFLSRATFARHFARVYHLTPQAWLSQLRMALAARLLRLERQTNLEVIAERCGFQSLASFSKRFKMRYGVTPGEWRRG